MIRLPIRAAALAALILAAPPLRAMQQDSATSRPAFVAFNVHTVIEVDSLDRAAFANVAELLQARVPGLHISRTGDGGMRWFMRGPSSVAESTPLVLVDDVRISMAGSGAAEFGTRPPQLDEIDVEDVERIEVLSGPATAAMYGAGAGNGVIRIVTPSPRAQKITWRLVTAAGSIDDAVTYPDNYDRTGTGSGGTTLHGCTLLAQAQAFCTPSGPLTAFNVFDRDSPFATALSAHLAGTVASGSEGFAWRGSATLDRHGSIAGDLANQRFHLRGSAALRAGQRAEVALRAHWMRCDADLPPIADFSPLRPTMLSQGLFAEPDTLWRGFYDPAPANYTSVRYGATANARWRPVPWLETRLTSGGVRFLDEDDLRYSTRPDPRFQQSHFVRRGERRRRDLTVRLDAQADYDVRGLSAATVVVLERAQSRLEHEFEGARTDVSGAFWAFWSNRVTEIAGAGVSQQLNLWPSATLGGGLRVDRAKVGDRRWDTPVSPHVSFAWDVRPFTPTRMGGARLRASLGHAANVPQTTELSFVPAGSFNERPPAEVTRERELGMDASAANDRVGFSLTWYHKRTSDVEEIRGSFLFGFEVDRIEVLNRGIEGLMSVRILETAHLTWGARLWYAYNHNEVTRQSSPPHRVELGTPSVWSRQINALGRPLGASATHEIAAIRDLDGDGLLDNACFEGGGCEVEVRPSPVYHPAFPPRSASLETSVRVGALTVGALLDHRSGHSIENRTLALRCAQRCQAAYDPATGLRDQAEAVAVSYSPFGRFVEDASFTKLREMWLRYAAPTRWANALGASRLEISVAGRNVATWTDYRGLDPETTSYSWIPLASFDAAAEPLPRRFLVRVDLGGR